MAPALFWTLLIIVALYAMVRGNGEQKLAATACVLAAILTVALVSPLSERYGRVEVGVALVDMALLAVFVGIALRSQRFWPLWIAGLHLTASLSHLMKASRLDLLPQAYAAAEKFWSYPILLIIAVAVWRFRKRIGESLESDLSTV
ncbi:hypothetical protein [Sphingomicrobium lutaoense]|uniref:O-antigen/teichoic acid export membrane protein n=1 Tax=Sphingomicrobium lutaoense TaxID=515949 RepID=A0A839Z1I6_9SPHN|nr:hypothetical protein [Sphingomicrobium lutaoense]MBB3764428.1 O-antigen/teichoic acid export membrane protein [Sphingomicrobium lutaoense]